MKTTLSNKQVQEISDFFKEYVFGFIYYDIDAAIDGKANFLAALALLTYTEFLGGLANGSFGIDAQGKMIPRQNSANFKMFFCCLGAQYQSLASKVDVYIVIRSGLVHQYFIKRDATIWTGPALGIRCGIEVRDNGHIDFYVEKYFADFKKAAGDYYNKLVIERDTRLVNKFLEARRKYLGHVP